MGVDAGHFFLLAAMAVLWLLYRWRFARHSVEVFSPAAAWCRAYLYFGCCALFAWQTGATNALLNAPWLSADNLGNPLFVTLGLALFVFVGFAYWRLWAGWTLTFDRRLDVFPQLVFGLSWGLAYTLCFLGFWHLAEYLLTTQPRWQVFVLAYAMISLWQYMWQDLYWDVYIAPEHDTPWTVKRKVPFTHIPNITLCLAFFAYYGEYWLFIAQQSLALVGCSLAMRMPAPWCREPTPPARRHPFVLGLVHGGGYIAEDPATDPHLKSINAPY